jgi:hypothetical protein
MEAKRLVPTPGENDGQREVRRSQSSSGEACNQKACRFDSAALIVNTRSRVGRSAAASVLDNLRLLGVPVKAAYALDDAARLPETVREALADGHDLIVVGGGDGSVSSVAGVLAGSGAVLGVLPLGTANDFARTMGIPFELGKACATIAHGVAPGSGIEDYALDVYAVEAFDAPDLARIAWGLRTGNRVDDKRVHYWRTRQVRILTDPRLPVNLDGELGCHTPKSFSVVPDALKVLVPQTQGRSSRGTRRPILSWLQTDRGLSAKMPGSQRTEHRHGGARHVGTQDNTRTDRNGHTGLIRENVYPLWDLLQ